MTQNTIPYQLDFCKIIDNERNNIGVQLHDDVLNTLLIAQYATEKIKRVLDQEPVDKKSLKLQAETITELLTK